MSQPIPGSSGFFREVLLPGNPEDVSGELLCPVCIADSICDVPVDTSEVLRVQRRLAREQLLHSAKKYFVPLRQPGVSAECTGVGRGVNLPQGIGRDQRIDLRGGD